MNEHWVGAGHLKIGDKIQKADGTTGTVKFVNTIQQTRTMYNLEVAEAHTFFVGTQGWLVHNGNGPYDKLTSDQLKKSLKSYQDLVDEHVKKLEDYRANPDAFDNKGVLKNASPEVRQNIIDGRIKALEKQVQKQQGEAQKILNEIVKRGC